MIDTLACDGKCGLLLEVERLKSFKCGHVFCEECLLGSVFCLADNCFGRSQCRLPSWCEYVDDVKHQAFADPSDFCSESSCISTTSSADCSSDSGDRTSTSAISSCCCSSTVCKFSTTDTESVVSEASVSSTCASSSADASSESDWEVESTTGIELSDG